MQSGRRAAGPKLASNELQLLPWGPRPGLDRIRQDQVALAALRSQGWHMTPMPRISPSLPQPLSFPYDFSFQDAGPRDEPGESLESQYLECSQFFWDQVRPQGQQYRVCPHLCPVHVPC